MAELANVESQKVSVPPHQLDVEALLATPEVLEVAIQEMISSVIGDAEGTLRRTSRKYQLKAAIAAISETKQQLSMAAEAGMLDTALTSAFAAELAAGFQKLNPTVSAEAAAEAAEKILKPFKTKPKK